MSHCSLVSTYPSSDWGHISFAEHLLDTLQEEQHWKADLLERHPSDLGTNHDLLTLPDGEVANYAAAAKWLGDSTTDVIGLHPDLGDVSEFGNLELAEFLTRLKKPVVTTLHSVGRQPTLPYKEAVREVVYLSDRVVVMTDRGAKLIASEYGVHPSKIDVIPHGVPELPFVDAEQDKGKLGLSGRTVLLTAGFVGPGKGIEFVLETISDLVTDHPDILYLVVGPLHPDLSTHDSDRYRRDLQERVETLGLTKHVRFVDTIPDRDELIGYMRASDVYVTPYPGCDESSTAMLAYAIGTGRAVVSTPSPYAEELLAEGDGHLLPYGDTVALKQSLRRLVVDDEARQILNKRAHRLGQSMTWPKVGEAYASLFDTVVRGGRQFEITSDGPHFPTSPPPIQWP